MQEISSKLYNWASILDAGTKDQAIVTSQMPFIFPHMALMPDAHLGKGSTVGSVVPTYAAVMPACVGVDIGCGMIAVKTDKHKDDLDGLDRKPLRQAIERSIPLSAGKYNSAVHADARWYIDQLRGFFNERGNEGLGEMVNQLSPNWELQLGTLGSGNHFIEVSYDEGGWVWLFLHSGSRGVGNKIAMKYIKLAQDLNRLWLIDLPDPDLAYLPQGTPEYLEYINAMTWAQDFALYNRKLMMDRLMRQFEDWAGTFEVMDQINCHHNFAQYEKHFGRTVLVTRKGAIEAAEGKWGLIPGSMGAASYVVQGLGERMSFNSAPHGAGRVHSRSSAKKTFTKESLEAAMEGIEWSHSDAFLDEHPDAYKDIDQVMEDAKDLVVIRHTLRQLINVKGD